MKIIALINQKGGVAKTTSAINLAAALKILNKKVLLIDLDPQGNATVGSGVEVTADMNTTHEFLLGPFTASECKFEKEYDIIPTDIRLATAELEIFSKFSRESLLKNKLKEITDYDYIIIDCPPSLSLLTINALVAADLAYIPVAASVFALTGLEQLKDTIISVQPLNNIEIGGVFLTRFDSREKFSHEVTNYLSEMFGEKLMNTKIRTCANINKAQVQGLDIFKFDSSSRSAEDYMSLAKELVIYG